jgi:hypothetical protein
MGIPHAGMPLTWPPETALCPHRRCVRNLVIPAGIGLLSTLSIMLNLLLRKVKTCVYTDDIRPRKFVSQILVNVIEVKETSHCWSDGYVSPFRKQVQVVECLCPAGKRKWSSLYLEHVKNVGNRWTHFAIFHLCDR